jgi:protein-tyrosine phosphatase
VVDLHHHLLPGIDDGAPDLATTLKMARMAADDGITHVVCTPHANGRYPFDAEKIQGLLAEVRLAIADVGIRLILGFGCDLHLSYDNVRDALANPRRYTVNAGEYVLVELPDYALPPTLEETFYSLRLAGMTPILTHPERNPSLQQDDSRLKDWIRDGMLTQVTASSVTGLMGRKAQKMAERMLADRWVHFLSTDAHNISTRPPKMREARDHIAARYGEPYAQRLCTENPQAVFDSRPLPRQEGPQKIFESGEDELLHEGEKRRGLLRRIFRR